MSRSRTRRATPVERTIKLSAVDFAVPVYGPGSGGRKSGWRVKGQPAGTLDGARLYPDSGLVVLTLGAHESMHWVGLTTRMVAAEPAGGQS